MASDTFPSKLALVTGAGVRLGRASALRLAAAGYDILVHYNSSAHEASETAAGVEAAGRKAFLMQADLSSPEGVEALAAQVAEHNGLDVLVNNAAIFYPSPKP